MSMLSEQVNQLKEEAKYLEKDQEKRLASILRQASDAIEALSAKLSAANMERSDRYYGGGWIACKDRLPENFEVILAFTEEKQIVTVARDGEHWVLYDQAIIKENVLAWQTLPEPYHP